VCNTVLLLEVFWLAQTGSPLHEQWAGAVLSAIFMLCDIELPALTRQVRFVPEEAEVRKYPDVSQTSARVLEPPWPVQPNPTHPAQNVLTSGIKMTAGLIEARESNEQSRLCDSDPLHTPV
jgi:hypothetical protein